MEYYGEIRSHLNVYRIKFEVPKFALEGSGNKSRERIRGTVFTRGFHFVHFINVCVILEVVKLSKSSRRSFPQRMGFASRKKKKTNGKHDMKQRTLRGTCVLTNLKLK